MRITIGGRVATLLALAMVLVTSGTGCATRFDAETIRSQIAAQRGADPLGVFELNLGRFTTLLLKSALIGEDGEVPFSGVRELQLAVFEVASPRGPALDTTPIPVRGWEPVLRAVDEKRSALVLVRQGTMSRWSAGAASSVGDLVVVGSGPKRVVYVRLRGVLDPELPGAMGDLLREGGPDDLQRVITELAEGSSGGG